jgi:hypothetical protein
MVSLFAKISINKVVKWTVWPQLIKVVKELYFPRRPCPSLAWTLLFALCQNIQTVHHAMQFTFSLYLSSALLKVINILSILFPTSS